MRWTKKDRLFNYLYKRAAKKAKWHRWFAWRPVELGYNDDHQKVWLEFVERKQRRIDGEKYENYFGGTSYSLDFYSWDYRSCEN